MRSSRDVDLAAVGLQLRFARAARSNAAAQLRHRLALARQPRQLVLQLRQLHLQHALARPRMARKNVQDQLRPVDHRARQPRFHVARLRRRQVVVEQHQARAGRSHRRHNLIQLAAAHQRRRIGLRRAAESAPPQSSRRPTAPAPETPPAKRRSPCSAPAAGADSSAVAVIVDRIVRARHAAAASRLLRHAGVSLRGRT